MRHNKTINHLGRTSSHRKAMLSNMASSLILHKRITTTVAKAKALKKYVEPLITKSKEDTTHNRRVVFSYLENKYAVSELFRDIAIKVGDRPGGYTRILRTATRLGDNADMCIIELVDYNEAMLSSKETKKKTNRRSRTKAKSSGEKTPVETKVVVEEPVVNEQKTEVNDINKEAEGSISQEENKE
ncbi:MAG: 50S ribosomal protein L17 [Bacteroidales bacterium]|jgi:large subunit ribosomal protein L17|nr:50S ribosomal protein L17 [Bacteroidales bacterium]